ncbi:MAG: integrase core domain-containing protein [Daejeonella sp.]
MKLKTATPGLAWFNAVAYLVLADKLIISMTENGDPLENAIAERVNGIMKQEYLEHQVLNNKEEVMELLRTSVNVYNKLRPHMSCNMFTPEMVHQNNLTVQ